MKITSRFMLFNVLLIAVALATAAGTFLNEIHVEAEKSALIEQEQRLKTFWQLLRSKGGDFRIVNGKLLAGDYLLNGNFELPDAIHEIFDCTATIFMGDTRISTNILKTDGSRAIGTRLQGPAYDAIFKQGKPFRGESPILGVPYFTAYDPIRNSKGEIIGALYVGVKKSDYFLTYEHFKFKVVAITALLSLIFSLLAVLLIKFRRKAEEALFRLNRVLRKLTKCNETLIRAQNETELLRDICCIVIEDGSYCFAWVGFAENDEGKTIRPMAQAGYEDGYLEGLNLTWADSETGRGPAGTAIRTGMPCVMKDSQNDPNFALWREQALHRGYRSVLSVPLVYATRVLGSLNVYASVPDAFDAEEQELMVQLANDLAYGIMALRTREQQTRTAEALFESAKEYQKLAAAHDQKQRLLRALLDSIPDLIFYKDPKSVYLGCNKAFEAFAGRPAESITGLTDLDLFPQPLAELFRQMDREMMSQRMARHNEEWVVYPDGRRALLDTLKAPFYDHAGNVLGLIGISRDITEQKRHDAEREKLETQLHQSQKIEAIGQLAGGIAHDFNNILTAIIGYSEIINLHLEKDSPLKNHVEQVLIAAERATDLTNGLLAFSRKQVLHTKPLDLCEVVRGMKKMLSRLIPEDIDFRTTFEEQALIVSADKGQIEQVLMNLVMNAKDAMQRGGTLLIDISSVFMDAGFVHAHGFVESGDYARITVTDSGHGMDEETQKKIFEPFFTTKEVGKGTGLGMAIIYGIVKQHKGYIIVDSKPGEGTTFHVFLPLINGDNREVPRVLEEEAPVGGTETILLAEDDVTVRELHCMILEQAGYSVIGAIDGRDALDKYMAHQLEVDMLVTDVIMPKLDGKRLFEEIREICPKFKALFMSGYTKDVFVERGILEDDFNFMLKPVSAFELLKKVRSILDHSIH